MPIINPAAQSQLALTLHSVHEPEPEPEQQAISTEVGKVGELHVSFPGQAGNHDSGHPVTDSLKRQKGNSTSLKKISNSVLGLTIGGVLNAALLVKCGIDSTPSRSGLREHLTDASRRSTDLCAQGYELLNVAGRGAQRALHSTLYTTASTADVLASLLRVTADSAETVASNTTTLAEHIKPVPQPVPQPEPEAEAESQTAPNLRLRPPSTMNSKSTRSAQQLGPCPSGVNHRLGSGSLSRR